MPCRVPAVVAVVNGRGAIALHYCGHLADRAGEAVGSGRFDAAGRARLAARIGRFVAAHEVRSAHGSLASGADLLAVEVLLGAAVSIHAVLPFAEDDFLDVSVRPAGAEWVERYAACRARVASIELVTEGPYGGDDARFGRASDRAMQAAVAAAARDGIGPWQLAVYDGRPSAGAAGTRRDLDRWHALGHPAHVVLLPPRRPPP